jgi:hypothetical protein
VTTRDHKENIMSAAAPNLVMPAIERQAVHDYACPSCGAKAGVRCRILTRYQVVPGPKMRTKVEVRQKPCGPRTALAIRGLAGG